MSSPLSSSHRFEFAFSADYPVNRPAFRSYIRFFNVHTAYAEVEIDCSTYSLILYYRDQIIIRTTEHRWSVGDSYYVTVDEGAVFSTPEMNSTAYHDPKFWTFRVVAPLYVEPVAADSPGN